ncbi:hypothetical protein BBO99_00004269 [Phytophthora kernoviae]|uniref:Uncharacterized protein n=2 Tax=Phytophthora kernoviae TaxID=325452 RepID=A0A3R7NHC7_9STRA|nr:hypothetical protein G195_005027 [Phytophthora kernoviae 00238/432]KAG2525658.1 hypothetical protein JM16_004262 [Phytophthora kernoviae]KAG2527398.1 hypothetical protein JM18_003626 [Phytophthora kernoviae]RLN21302.1 hypothetical protein BBI17_006678 [Phytophthora kernoviae]RLN80746.1 hypothetical protein BBO99_00004269 [Phytophthora kernoviae]
MGAVAPGGSAPNKNSPHLHSVASSLRSCLDGMLPDNLRNDGAAFQQHLVQQKSRLQTEKNSWRFGLNYLFETLKQHKDWYGRNQQFVQLRKDVKRFETHVATVRTILSESVSKLDLEAGLRGAELEGRVGAYKIMFEVTKIVSNLSRPLVKLQILKPNESSLSIYCDTFVLDIVLAGGEGAVESASLTTVEKEPPRKRVKLDDTQSSAVGSAAAGGASSAGVGPTSVLDGEETNSAADGRDGSNEKGTSSPTNLTTLSPLANGEWSGNISFIEWRGEVALHVVGHTPLVMVGLQARNLALLAMHKHSDVVPAVPKDVHEDEKLFNEFVSWTTPDGKKPVLPQLHFARDHSVCSVYPTRSPLAMRQEFSLTTKEISGGLKLHSFPIPLSNASTETLTSVLQVCGRSLFFHAILLSAFCSRSNTFGQRIPADSEDVVNAHIKVDVAAAERITMNTGELLGPDKQVLIEVSIKADCTMDVSLKYQAESQAANTNAIPALENAATLQKLASACHSIPLLTYYALKRTLQTKNGPSSSGATRANGEDCNGIAALDGDLSVSMKMEGEGMLLDEMDMF